MTDRKKKTVERRNQTKNDRQNPQELIISFYFINGCLTGGMTN